MRLTILLFTCLTLILLIVVNIYKFNQQNIKFNEQLKMHNKRVIFVSNPNLDIKEECYKPEGFFVMHNTGNDPCEETKAFEYKTYSTREDYYMKKSRYEL